MKKYMEISKQKRNRKVINKKLLKEKNLFESAYELFTNKGINKTSIDDIVKRAGVAKGTFYRYFKDKCDITDKIVLKKSSTIIKQAAQYSANKNCDDIIEAIIFFIDHIIENLRENKRLLKLIHKNLSWGLFRKALANPDEYKEMQNIKQIIMDAVIKGKLDLQDVEKTLFMIIELTGTVCYSSIILEEPASIDEMKPLLFKMIRKMISK